MVVAHNRTTDYNGSRNSAIISKSQIISCPYPSRFVDECGAIAKRNSCLAPYFIIDEIVPVVVFLGSVARSKRQGQNFALLRNRFGFVAYLYRNLELSRC